MAGRRRLQELFARYDLSGDGVLSEAEMKNVFGKVGISEKDAESVFQAADSNKDGVIQVHEFISWLTAQKTAVKAVQDTKQKNVTVHVINSSDRVSKRFTFTFNGCKNMAFPLGNPAEFLLSPGEEFSKVMLEVAEKGKAWKWSYRWSSRSEFAGVEDDPNAFQDGEFPHDNSSIGESSTKFNVGSPEVWVRARALGDPAEAVLFDQIRPQDIVQGSLGDCWLLSCLCSLADYPSRIKSLFPSSRQLNEEGKYVVQLFDIGTEAWTETTVNEFIPCNIKNGVAVPTFAKPLGEEIWVQLIEKAMAKFCGSYGALSGGGVAWAFQVLTGAIHVLSFEKLSENNWRRRFMHQQKQLERGARNPRSSWWKWQNKDTHDTNQLFELLQSHRHQDHILSCMIASPSGGAEAAKGNGLYLRHYYAVLNVVSEKQDDGTEVHLVLLRNPWGRSEWSGDWSDSSEKWERNPNLMAKLDTQVRLHLSCTAVSREGFNALSAFRRWFVGLWTEETMALTKTIAEFAKSKQLQRAISIFEKFEKEGLQPSVYTFSSLINAYVRTADLAGALEIMSNMKTRGIKPNVSIFTILLKGYCQAGDLRAARELLDEMVEQGVAPDARAVNAFFRGCVYHGDVPMASEVFSEMESSWQLVPDFTSLRYVVQLFSQGLRVNTMKHCPRKLQKATPSMEDSGAKKMGQQACKFWASGTCTKGVNCKFSHDLEASPEIQERLQREKAGAMAAMSLSLAHAAAMLGRWVLCRRALNRAEEFYTSDDGSGSHGLFQELSREEASREIRRISRFLHQEQQPEPYPFLCRTFLFGGSSCAEKAELAQWCVDELVRSFGLGEMLLRAGLSEEDALASFRRCFSKKLRLRSCQIFASGVCGKRKIDHSDPSLPLKMEICSGNGDWVVAQAKAEQGLANWMALELRHDRVHQIFSRLWAAAVLCSGCIPLLKDLSHASQTKLVNQFAELECEDGLSWAARRSDFRLRETSPSYIQLHAMRRRVHEQAEQEATATAPSTDAEDSETKLHGELLGQSFMLTKSIILRLLGLMYFVAFKVAADQNLALMGSQGLTPVAQRWEEHKKTVTALQGFQEAPSIFWFTELSDQSMQLLSYFGLACSLAMMMGLHSSILAAALWLSYFSIVTSAEETAWYRYGWESQLLETGFLAVFICSPLDLSASPSLPVLWLFRWLCFRISTGAGLIKVRGSSCWTDRTCLWYHFETQPNPSPLSFLWHFLPRGILSAGVDLDICVQLYAAWLVLVPGWGPLRHLRRLGGLIQVFFMLNIALSGNFSFLNHLTIVPALACLDDDCLSVFCTRAAKARLGATRRRCRLGLGGFARWTIDLALVSIIAYLSVPVVQNLLQSEGKRQMMNAYFGAFRLVNTYGAFGNVGKERYEAIVSVSHDKRRWYELEFPCKPGSLTRRPCLCAPYHYRLDWNIWFLGFKPHQVYLERRETWMWSFLAKVLEGDATVLSLLTPETAVSKAYFPDGPLNDRKLPKFAKVDMWRYRMRAPLWVIAREYAQNGTAVWWEREKAEALIPPLERNYTVLVRMLQHAAI
ncbi:Lmf1 [Symbiodinium sp. CCMP2456]|nr:Lmf1 [Symbiodinium sp. CCMP2456]